MVGLQILSQVLQTQDISIIEANDLTADFFPEYQEEYEFIMSHYKEYGNVPDKLSFLAQFNNFEIVEVNESEKYLIDTIREENLYSRAVPVVQNVAKLMKTDSNSAVEYMMNAIKDLQPNYNVGGVDIIHSHERFNAFVDKKQNQKDWFFTTGFPELDDIIHGINRVEELFVIVARINQGKSWILEKMCTHVWEIGYNIGYISPEMSDLLIGYRFDTLHNNFSNKDLVWGNDSLSDDDYGNYMDELQQKPNKFIVATPLDFKNRITVSKLRQFIKKYDLDLLAIDGITYLSDERYVRGDSKTISLTNISADLKTLSMELKVPILLVQQVNRSGVIDKESDELPGLDSIRDSDGIAASATSVLALKQCEDNILVMELKKGRNSGLGSKISYRWNPNIGEFISDSIPSMPTRSKKKKVEKEDMF